MQRGGEHLEQVAVTPGAQPQFEQVDEPADGAVAVGDADDHVVQGGSGTGHERTPEGRRAGAGEDVAAGGPEQELGSSAVHPARAPRTARETASDTMTTAIPASSTRQAVGRANTGRSRRAPYPSPMNQTALPSAAPPANHQR